MSELPGFPGSPGNPGGPDDGGGPGRGDPGRAERWRVRGVPASRPLQYIVALVVAPPLGLFIAHAPLLLLVVLGPLGWSLMAAGFALALGAAAVMYGAMLLGGLPLLLLISWAKLRGLAPYGLAGLGVGLATGLLLADWVGQDPAGFGAVLLGLGLGLYGAWLGLCMGVIAGLILLAAEVQQRAQAAGPVIIEAERDPH